MFHVQEFTEFEGQRAAPTVMPRPVTATLPARVTAVRVIRSIVVHRTDDLRHGTSSNQFTAIAAARTRQVDGPSLTASVAATRPRSSAPQW